MKKMQALRTNLGAQSEKKQKALEMQSQLHKAMILRENAHLYLNLDVQRDQRILALQDDIPCLPQPCDPNIQAYNLPTITRAAVEDILRRKIGWLAKAENELEESLDSWNVVCKDAAVEMQNVI